MQRRQPRIAGSDAIVTLGLQKGQEVLDLLGGEIDEVEIFDRLGCLRRSKAQEQNDGIPVVAYGCRLLPRSVARYSRKNRSMPLPSSLGRWDLMWHLR